MILALDRFVRQEGKLSVRCRGYDLSTEILKRPKSRAHLLIYQDVRRKGTMQIIVGLRT